MESSVFPLFLFPNVAWWKSVIQTDSPLIEIHENWVKQSFRSRFEIAGPNGRQVLSIPTHKSSRTTLNDVTIDYTEKWPILHWRSIRTAYNRSPFFEFYADELKELLDRPTERLVDLNKAALQWCCDKLGVEKKFQWSESYISNVDHDFRNKMPDVEIDPYMQVFDEKNGFIANLSILDVLFNCGPEAGSLMR